MRLPAQFARVTEEMKKKAPIIISATETSKKIVLIV